MSERHGSAIADGATAYLSNLVATSKVPGLQYVVVDAAQVLFEYHSGWADVTRRMPMEGDTSLMAYSMSKTITAVAVLQLVESGRVGLDAPLDTYADDSPYGPRVTVRQLIAHTSGIANPIPLRWVHPAAAHAAFDERAALSAVLRAHPRLVAAPGARYRYSNIGYWLLGLVVERASGRPFQAYVGEHVLKPLRIAPEQIGYVVADPARHATGYLEKYSLMNLVKGVLIDRALVGGYAGPWLEIRSHYPNGPAFGGLVGTARAFGQFLQDQLQPRSALLGDARKLLYAQQQTSGGAPIAMTLGWHISDRGGTRCFYKEGGGGGFHCLMRLYPHVGLASVLMTNATGFDVTAAMDIVDSRFVQAER